MGNKRIGAFPAVFQELGAQVKSHCQWLPGFRGGDGKREKRRMAKGHKEICGVMDIFIILTEVMVSSIIV